MHGNFFEPKASDNGVVLYLKEEPRFKPGERVRVSDRAPLGHYRVPRYLRGREGVVETVISPIAVDNEREGFGRNAGDRGRYYRICVRMRELWADYEGNERDSLNIEVFEDWLEKHAEER